MPVVYVVLAISSALSEEAKARTSYLAKSNRGPLFGILHKVSEKTVKAVLNHLLAHGVLLQKVTDPEARIPRD